MHEGEKDKLHIHTAKEKREIKSKCSVLQLK